MNGKKIVIGAVLIAVAIVAVVVAVKRTQSRPERPAWMMDQQIQKIDIKSLEVVTKRLSDWEAKYAPDASGRFKNPKTGEYTMVEVMRCKACGQFIPKPSEDEMLHAGTPEERRLMVTCPRCGKNIFGVNWPNAAGGPNMPTMRFPPREISP